MLNTKMDNQKSGQQLTVTRHITTTNNILCFVWNSNRNVHIGNWRWLELRCIKVQSAVTSTDLLLKIDPLWLLLFCKFSKFKTQLNRIFINKIQFTFDTGLWDHVFSVFVYFFSAPILFTVMNSFWLSKAEKIFKCEKPPSDIFESIYINIFYSLSLNL